MNRKICNYNRWDPELSCQRGIDAGAKWCDGHRQESEMKRGGCMAFIFLVAVLSTFIYFLNEAANTTT